jgi:cyclin G2
MAEIIENKLGVQLDSSPVSGLTFIRLFYHIFRNAAKELGLSEFYESAIVLSDLEQKMEILACDASCASIRPSELALVMLCTQMDASVSNLVAGTEMIHGLVDYAIQMQKLCRVSCNFAFKAHRSSKQASAPWLK